MKIMEIIQDAFIFPSKNLGSLAIYIVLSILLGTLAFGVMISSMTKFIGFTGNFILGIIYLVVSIMIGFVMSGYLLRIVKSGIEKEEESPDFIWNENFNDGFNNIFLSFVYYFIPTISVITLIFIMNIPDKIMAVFKEMITHIEISRIIGNSSAVGYAFMPTMGNLMISLAVIFAVALILFIIVSLIFIMAEARLANTGSLEEAFNFIEAAKDIKRIGIGKVIGLIIALLLIIFVIEVISSAIFTFAPALSIFSIIITPYCVFFVQRAIGLLYSDIA